MAKIQIKKSPKIWKTFKYFNLKKLLSEFFVFVHELINSACGVNQLHFTSVERVRS